MSYQKDTTRQEVAAHAARRPDLTPFTMELTPEFHAYVFSVATSAIHHTTGKRPDKARKEAKRRGLRLLSKNHGCLICESPPEFVGAFLKKEGGRIIIYPLCEAHTTLTTEELDTAVLEAEANIYGVS